MFRQILSLLVIFAVGFFILANFAVLLYLFFVFMVVSAIFYWINQFRQRFKQNQSNSNTKQSSGRIIDSNEWHQL